MEAGFVDTMIFCVWHYLIYSGKRLFFFFLHTSLFPKLLLVNTPCTAKFSQSTEAPGSLYKVMCAFLPASVISYCLKSSALTLWTFGELSVSEKE